MSYFGDQEDLRIFAEDRVTGWTPQTWAVRVVRPGNGYGLYDERTEKFALTFTEADQSSHGQFIEFYDCRFSHTPFGQFVARYGSRELMKDRESLPRLGLCLDAGIPSWTISAAVMKKVFAWLDGRVGPRASISQWLASIQRAYDGGDFATVGELLADGEMNDRVAQLKE